jgi:hypothetical protein
LDIIAADGGVPPAPTIGCFNTNGMVPSIDNRNQGLVLYYVKYNIVFGFIYAAISFFLIYI